MAGTTEPSLKGLLSDRDIRTLEYFVDGNLDNFEDRDEALEFITDLDGWDEPDTLVDAIDEYPDEIVDYLTWYFSEQWPDEDDEDYE